MNKKIFQSFFLFLMTIPVLCQSIEKTDQGFQKNNSINLEIGGYTVMGNIFYERVIINNQKFRTTGQVGYGVEGIPLVINELLSFNNNHVELGLGVLLPGPFYHDGRANSKPFITGRLGYRFQRPGGGFIFRFGLMPIVTDDTYGMYINGTLVNLWPGLSFGYAF